MNEVEAVIVVLLIMVIAVERQSESARPVVKDTQMNAGNSSLGGKSNSNRNAKRFFTEKDAKHYMKSMWAKQGSGCFDSDSDDFNDKDSWKSGLNQAKQMHVLASAGIDPNERNIDIDDDDPKRIESKLENASRRNEVVSPQETSYEDQLR